MDAGGPSGLELRKVDLGRLNDIATSAVQLAALGPRLASYAGELEREAQAQARRAAEVARTMEELTRELDKAVAALQASSGQVAEALGAVSKIADHTRIISLNASIEAARAGLHGRAFGVVVEEVRRLADQTGDTTKLISSRLDEMEGSIARVSAVAGQHDTQTAGSQAKTSIGAMNGDVQGMAATAGRQLDGAQALHSLSDDVERHTESLLLSVGSFRFEVHQRAAAELESVFAGLLPLLPDKHACEELLSDWLQRHTHFELAYLTDATGRQFVDNLNQADGRVTHDPSGFRRDWSERPWFLEALETKNCHCSDIYRSTATQDFCFTVSAALRDEAGQVLAVIGADVNFKRLCQR